MAKKRRRRISTIFRQINRKLAAKSQILTKATPWMKLKLDFGDYYILDLRGNVMDTHVDPKKLARKWGVLLTEGKEVERRSEKTGPKKQVRPER